MMHMQDAPPGEVCGCNEETMTIVLIDEAYDKVQILARFEQMFEDGILFCWSVRDRGNEILDDIAG